MKFHKKIIGSTVLVILAATLSTAASASLITGVTASTDMGSGFSTNIQNTVNGVGLSSLGLNATHDATTPSNSWVSSGTLTGTVTFDLGGSYRLDGFSFWNQNGGGPGSAGTTGLKDVDVLFSSDGVNFSLWLTEQFAQVSGSFGLAPELINPVDVTASFVRFNVRSNWGDTQQSGFAEVQFDSAQVPEPASLALLGLGLVGLRATRRMRKSKS